MCEDERPNNTIAEQITVWEGIRELDKEFNETVRSYENSGYRVLSVVPYGDFSKNKVFSERAIGYNVIFTKEGVSK